MNWRGALFALAAIAPLVAPAQDIAPEVLLLSRIRDHVREELAHLPNYTCTETMQRFRKKSGARETLRNCYEITLPLQNVLGYSGVDG